MKIIKPSATLMEHNVTPYEFIEKVGRTCYKSEDKITEGSAVGFVKNLVKRDHWAMLEHETIYLDMDYVFMTNILNAFAYAGEIPKFFNMTFDSANHEYILSGSFRSFYDLFKLGLKDVSIRALQEMLTKKYPEVFGGLKYEPLNFIYNHNCRVLTREEFKKFKRPEVLFKHLTHTFLFVCDRGVTHEFVRHRVASFAQESTRYCNYEKDKFGGEITVIEPFFFMPDGDKVTTENWSERYGAWKHSCEVAEESYFRIIRDGGTPQEARAVLPHSLKTELIVTATEEEWQHIVDLRYIGVTGAPHPQIKEVMELALDDLMNETLCRVNIADKE